MDLLRYDCMVPVTMEEWIRQHDPYEEQDYGELITDYQDQDAIDRSWINAAIRRPDGAAGV